MLDFLHSIFPRTEPRYDKVKTRLNFESIPLLQIKDDIEKIYYNEEGKSGKKVKKVKILMRKEAASKLLSKCRNGGILEYKDLDQDDERFWGKSYCSYSYNAKED